MLEPKGNLRNILVQFLFPEEETEAWSTEILCPGSHVLEFASCQRPIISLTFEVVVFRFQF